MSVPSYPQDPGYQDPGDGQPLYPTISDYPNRTRFGSSPASRFRPVVGKTAKPAKAKAAEKPPKATRTQAGPTRAALSVHGDNAWARLVEEGKVVDAIGN